MRIRKFEAATIQQAMAKVREELGEEAVILHTRKFPGRFFGLLGRARVEVTAAIEDQQPYYQGNRRNGLGATGIAAPMAEPTAETRVPLGLNDQQSAHAAAQEFLTKLQKIRQSTTQPETSPVAAQAPTESPAKRPAVPEPVPSVDPNRFEALEVRIDRLANTMDRLLSIGGPLGQMGVLTEVPDPWHGAIKKLLESSLSEGVMSQIAKRLREIPHPGKDLEQKILREVLSSFIAYQPPICKPERGQRVIALIGPTGVGKTTTLAKLAGGLVVDPNTPTRVGLITVDTYRLAADIQLRKYAEILGVELDVVFGPEEMAGALEKCRHADVVFIDTAGRSPRDEAQMADLKSFLDQVPGCERYLVLSSTMNDRYLQETVERFHTLSINSLIITKMDETRNFASPFNTYHLTHLPISYLTTGQNVPEDIESVEPGRLAERLLSEIFSPAADVLRDQKIPALA